MPAARPTKETVTETATRLAPRVRVLIHNDDVTPMELVVTVLRKVFEKSPAEADQIMLEAHHTGVALVAVLLSRRRSGGSPRRTASRGRRSVH